MREAFYVFMTLAYFLFKKGLASLTLDMFASKLGKWEISAMEFNKIKNQKNKMLQYTAV